MSEREHAWSVAALFAFALVIGAYFSFRYAGRWAEQDTSSLAISIRALLSEQTLASPTGRSYSSGYAFPAVSVFIIAFTGLDTTTLLQALYPLVSASLVLIAWPLYREMTGSGRGATMATLLLAIQPEFLFVVLRGSHERVLRALLFLSLLLLLRSFRHAEQTRRYGLYVFLFYLSVYGVVATNSFFGSSYVAALAIALIGSRTVSFLGGGLSEVTRRASRRLLYIPLMCTLLVFTFNTYVYPSAGHGIGQLPDIFDKVTRLLLTTSARSAQDVAGGYDPYAVVAQQWIDTRVYFLISLGTWLLIISSVVIWARTGLRWLARAGEPPTPGQWLMWTLYAAFLLQGVLAIAADRSGSLGGNLQYRSFPSFAMVATPLVASELVRWRPVGFRRLLAVGALGLFALLAVFKSSVEPALSNGWTFYHPAEVAASRFLEARLRDNYYWADFDERIRTTQQLTMDAVANAVGIASGPPDSRTFLVTDIIRLRAIRQGRPLPTVGGELRIYDNGTAQVYRTRTGPVPRS